MEPQGPAIREEDGIYVQNMSMTCSDGLRLAGQVWGRTNHTTGPFVGTTTATTLVTTTTATTTTTMVVDSPNTKSIRILCLHGFLDNCRSFAALAPRLLASRHAPPRHTHDTSSVVVVERVVAMDFPGHGRSSHKSSDHPPSSIMLISDLVVYVAQIVHALNWERFVLIGHSMGAMASILYAGTYPHHVQHLILLDGFGPDFERPTRVVSRLKQHIVERYEGNTRNLCSSSSPPPPPSSQKQQQQQYQHPPKQQQESPPLTARRLPKISTRKTYRTIHDAIQTRQQTAIKSPGRQWLSYPAADKLVRWAVVPVASTKGRGTSSHGTSGSKGGWQFRHDPRLSWTASLQAFTLEQAFDFWKSLREGGVPTLWLRAQDGWPFSPTWLDRTERFLGTLGTTIVLPGSHHFHLDPETVDAVADCVRDHVLFPKT